MTSHVTAHDAPSFYKSTARNEYSSGKATVTTIQNVGNLPTEGTKNDYPKSYGATGSSARRYLESAYEQTKFSNVI